ncbi:MAG: threonine synthase [Cyclobacteriaceae bacterium]|jgi:threonine synthase
MNFYSTNHSAPQVSFKEAVLHGMPPDNGLYMPLSIPKIPAELLNDLPDLNFQELALEISKLWLNEDIDEKWLKKIVYEAIDFDATLHKVKENIFSLELYHGPTYAFKDFGARFMARLLSHFVRKESNETVILVATSGDTGSAVAQGFYKIPGIYVVLLYPGGKVSKLQEKQITTIGGNVTALEVDGTFDDCQMLVKQAFLDEDLNDIMHLTSANSINFARLLPQSFYYIYAYAQLKQYEKPIVFSIPSGNFGNMCGALLAKKMGIPIHHLIAATNANNIVPQYLESGKFEPRPSLKTISNAMDVGNPSNFPRILELYGNKYENVIKDIHGSAYSDHITKKAILNIFKERHYLMCPHSAIGYLGLHDYLLGRENEFTGVFVSTAHPAKFSNEINKFLDYEIAFPHGLKSVMNKKKVSVKMNSDYEDFKRFLLKASWRKK